MKVFLRLLKLVRHYWKHLAGAFICILLMAMMNILLIPIVSRISDAIGAKDFAAFNYLILIGLGLYFIRALSLYGQIFLTSFIAQRVGSDLQIKIFSHLQDLSLDFYAKWRTGEIISRSIDDMRLIQRAILATATELLPNIITIIGVIGYLFYLNWNLTLVTLLAVPLLAFVTTKLGQEMRQASKNAQMKVADMSSILQENIIGARVVKAFAMEKHERGKFNKEVEHNFWFNIKKYSMEAFQTPVLGLIQVLAIVAVIWYGGFLVLSGRLSASSLIAFFTGIFLIAEPIASLGRLNAVIQGAIGPAERVFEIIDIKPTIKQKANAIKLEHIKGKVSFDKVTFAYERGTDHILYDISLTAQPGESIALVGPSGAGKTTFVNLLPRFYDPTSGKILIDDHNIKDLDLEALRSQMGIVPQETILFSGTVKQNIAYGKMEANEDEIIKAAKMANAHDFINELSSGYETQVGERGLNLSGGQRQRIAMARAFLRDPKILILDEATSALDTESEKLVQDAMQHLMKGRTTFVIAHRLSTVQFADRIVVFDKGRIVEQGKHAELITKGGLYKRLYELQFKYEKNTDNN